MTTAIKSKSVRRVVVLQADASGGYTPVTVYRKRSTRRKKISRNKRPLEKAVRRISKAVGISANSYSARHERSNEKKRNGWSKDFSKNMRRANKKGRKEAKLKKLNPI